MCMAVGVFILFYFILFIYKTKKLYFEGWEALKIRLLFFYFYFYNFQGLLILPKNKAIVSRVM